MQPSFDTQLTTSRLLLRPARPDDVTPHYEAACESLEEVGRWLTWCTPDMRREDSDAWVAKCREAWSTGEFYSFFAFERRGDKFVGCCTINDLDLFRKRANLGYWIRSSQQGRGFATEAALAVARFGFDRLHLMRLEVVAAAGNVISQRVAGKLGATCEGLARNRLRIHEVQNDAYVFSLIPGDVPPA